MFLKLLSLIVVGMLTLQSCSDNEDMELVEVAANSIELRTDKLSYNPGAKMKFKVIGSQGQDITSRTSIFANPRSASISMTFL